MSKQSRVISTVVHQENLYRLQVDVLNAYLASDLGMWHRRYGHINPQIIMDMEVKQAVYGLSIDKKEIDRCSACILGKQTKIDPRFIKHIRSKTKVLSTFREVIAETKSLGLEVRYLHSDDGTEFALNEFKAYLRDNGMNQSTSVTYQPEQNGKAKRENRNDKELA